MNGTHSPKKSLKTQNLEEGDYVKFAEQGDKNQKLSFAAKHARPHYIHTLAWNYTIQNKTTVNKFHYTNIHHVIISILTNNRQYNN